MESRIANWNDGPEYLRRSRQPIDVFHENLGRVIVQFESGLVSERRLDRSFRIGIANLMENEFNQGLRDLGRPDHRHGGQSLLRFTW